jgi:hypothetical protein
LPTTQAVAHAAALLDKLIAKVPFRIEGIQVDDGSEFRAEFEEACRERNLCLFVRSGPSSTATSNAPKARGDTSSTASKTSHPASNRSSSADVDTPADRVRAGLAQPQRQHGLVSASKYCAAGGTAIGVRGRSCPTAINASVARLKPHRPAVYAVSVPEPGRAGLKRR